MNPFFFHMGRRGRTQLSTVLTTSWIDLMAPDKCRMPENGKITVNSSLVLLNYLRLYNLIAPLSSIVSDFFGCMTRSGKLSEKWGWVRLETQLRIVAALHPINQFLVAALRLTVGLNSIPGRSHKWQLQNKGSPNSTIHSRREMNKKRQDNWECLKYRLDDRNFKVNKRTVVRSRHQCEATLWSGKNAITKN